MYGTLGENTNYMENLDQHERTILFLFNLVKGKMADNALFFTILPFLPFFFVAFGIQVYGFFKFYISGETDSFRDGL